MTGLSAFGLNAHVERAFADVSDAGLVLGRVLAVHGNMLRVTHGRDDESLALLSGRLRRTDTTVAVGDWVATRASDGHTFIQVVLARQSVLQRNLPGRRVQVQVLAANVDTALLMMGLDDNYNPRRLARYLVMVRDGGVQPVVVLNKMDVCPDALERQADLQQRCPGIPVLSISASHGLGTDQLDAYFTPGKTVVLLGSSGVGKSTLTNRLLGFEQQRTSEVRGNDSHGRHTTSHRELMLLPGGGLLIDTPGLREVQLWDGDGDGFDDAFSPISEYARQCRFMDCNHDQEPHCAVRAAIESGQIDTEELFSWHKLQRELHYHAARQDQRVRIEEHRRGQLHKRRPDRDLRRSR